MNNWLKKTLTGLLGITVLGLMLIASGCSSAIKASHFPIAVDDLPEHFELRIVHISDLHGAEFGPNNEHLARIIEQQDPDLIFVSGDMIDSKGDDGSAFINLLDELKGLFPVYCSMGNHEQIVRRMPGTERFNEFAEELRNAGAVLLDNERVEINWGGVPVSIYGFTAMLYHYTGSDTAEWEGAALKAQFIEETIGPPREGEVTLLLAHNPKYFEEYALWGADLIFAGHIHGGVIRLPVLGGVLSPDLTYFPPYDAGIYQLGAAKMHVSRGLGNSVIPFRIFNPPDVSLIVLTNIHP